ncbi:caveolin-2 isoform X2 [Vicugna pacos]|uniref:Caveolin n=1 Tax=Vicugna pacos TaxID=30538 RepID=A0ABM5DIJ9_VICPA
MRVLITETHFTHLGRAEICLIGTSTPHPAAGPGPDWDPTREGRREVRGGSHLAGCVRPPPPGRAAGRDSGCAGPGNRSRQRKAAAARAARGEAGRDPALREGEAARARSRAAPRQPGCSHRAPNAAMGLETEKADVQLFMDDDSYSRHSGIDYGDPEKFADLGTDRDPHRLNSHLKVGFDDVIAEPVSTHSFDKVWICSHALFEISKYVIYKFLTVFLAIPLAFAAGILFATLSCLHICRIFLRMLRPS